MPIGWVSTLKTLRNARTTVPPSRSSTRALRLANQIVEKVTAVSLRLEAD